jgi:hypothetical protein
VHSQSGASLSLPLLAQLSHSARVLPSSRFLGSCPATTPGDRALLAAAASRSAEARAVAKVAQGATVLFALPLGLLASRMRERFQGLPHLDIDTCHGAFKLDRPDARYLPLVAPYDMVVVDEISLLSQEHFEQILQLWRAADKVPALVFLGDKFQLPGMGDARAWDSACWNRRELRFLQLLHPFRCKDPAFAAVLKVLRISKPSERLVEQICCGHKAWPSRLPTTRDVAKLIADHPDTTLVTATRRGAQLLNDLALEAIFRKRSPLAILPGDPEMNPTNYVNGKFRSDTMPEPMPVPIFKGMHLYLTKNISKESDFVNGMSCTVEAYCAASGVLKVRTKTNMRLVVFRWTDIERGRATFFPIRLGYASTINKVQGDEFRHITIWLDAENVPAAGYTALSRVERATDYLLGGWMTPAHFVPATHR